MSSGQTLGQVSVKVLLYIIVGAQTSTDESQSEKSNFCPKCQPVKSNLMEKWEWNQRVSRPAEVDHSIGSDSQPGLPFTLTVTPTFVLTFTLTVTLRHPYRFS